MENEIKEVNIEETDWKDSYLRLRADFENYKKRASKEKEELDKERLAAENQE